MDYLYDYQSWWDQLANIHYANQLLSIQCGALEHNGTTEQQNYGQLRSIKHKLWSTTMHDVALGASYVVPITGDFTTVQSQQLGLLNTLSYCFFSLMETIIGRYKSIIYEASN